MIPPIDPRAQIDSARSGSDSTASGPVDSVHAPVLDFFELSLDNICVAGLDGYFKRVNPSWTRTLGWTHEELLSRPSVEFVHPDDRERTLGARKRLSEGAHMGPLVNRYLCKDGSIRWFEWRSVADVSRGLVYGTARDITEQKRAEEQLAEAQANEARLHRQLLLADRMASVGTLAAGVAHEINNPLAAVMANVELILEQLNETGVSSSSVGSLAGSLDELRAMATDAAAGAERIRTIVLRLKTFSRTDEERRLVIDVVPVLERAVALTRNEVRQRARLVEELGPVPPVMGDDARLGQVFTNLIVNAVQSLPERDSADNELRIITLTDGAGRAVIEFRDTGSGIPARILDRIFDPFFTTKAIGVGTGLGLSICHGIVTAMGGEITVASVEGQGTSVRVVLPAAVAAPVVTASSAVASTPSPTRAAVLVIDDEPSVGKVLGRVLREHEVTVVTSGGEALALLAAGRRFDVILSDLMMPGMSGMDLHEQLERSFPEAAARVVFISGGAFTPSANAFLDRVTNERIDKPFDPGTVRALVQRRTRSR